MAYVLLILGLIAAGIYTGAWGFYVAAGVAAFFWLIMVMLVAAIAASVKDIAKKGGNINVRRKF